MIYLNKLHTFLLDLRYAHFSSGTEKLTVFQIFAQSYVNILHVFLVRRNICVHFFQAREY